MKKPVRGLSADMLQPQPAATTPEVLTPPALSLAPEAGAAPALGARAAQTAPEAPRPSTQTVKVPESEFIRLKTLSARSRRKHQDILLTALREYLDRQGA